MDDGTTQAKARDELFERLLQRRSWLRGLARAIVADAAEADDVVQDACIAALQRSSQTSRGLDPWLSSVVRRLALLMRRREGRLRQREERAARPERLPSTADLVERIDTEQRLAAGVLALVEPYRTTLLLRFYEGLSAAEIARQQRIPEGTVRWRIKRGLDELRPRLKRDFGGSEALGIALVGLICGPGPTPAASSPFDAASGGKVAAAKLAATGVGAMVGAKWLAAGAIGIVLAATWIGFTGWMPRSDSGSPEVPRDVRIAADHSARVDHRQTSSPQAPAAKSVRTPLAIEASSQLSSVAAEVMRLRILESDGSPNSGKLVVLKPKRGEAEPVSGMIDENGWIELEATGQKRELAIERADAFPFRSIVELAPGERVIELPEGEGLSGRIVVDGAPLAKAIMLELVGAEDANTEFNTDDPERAVLHERALTRTGTSGEFLFRGLESSRPYCLRMPRGYAKPGTRRYSGPNQRLLFPIAELRNGLVLDVERHIALRGRIVEADGSMPVLDAIVDARLTWANGTTMDTGARSDADGFFEIFLHHRARRVALQYGSGPFWRGSARAEFELDSSTNDLDVGDLPLVEGRRFSLRIQDPEGKPIAGARTSVSGPSDDEGMIHVRELGAHTAAIDVVARGYRKARVDLPADTPDPFLVTLAPTNELIIEVLDREGRPLSGVGIRLKAHESLLQDGVSPLLRGNYEGSFRISGGTGDECRTSFAADQDGRLSLGALRPGFPLEIAVLDSCGKEVHAERCPPLGETEKRLVSLRTSSTLRTLRGRVLDARGDPVIGALVTPRPVDPNRKGPWKPWTTRAGGRFEVPLLSDGEYRLAVNKRGYLPLERELHVPAEEIELVLQKGLDLEVRVEDSHHRVIPGGSLRFVKLGAEHGPATSAPVAEGVFELAGLEDAPYELELQLVGASFRATVDPTVATHVFTLPVMGSVEAIWDLALDERSTGWLWLNLEPKNGACTGQYEGFIESPAGSHFFETVLPGEYELSLSYGGGWLFRTPDDPVGWLVQPIPVTVLAGETTKVALRP